MPAYVAFDKPLSDVRADDLQQLEGKRETFWLEYKSEVTNDSLAKSIASFANHRGGWVFIGIGSDEANQPCLDPAYLGLPAGAYNHDTLRQIVASNLQPVPDVQVHQVCLGSDRVVWVLAVEEGMDPPYIRMSDGRVYVRSGETSRPVALTDRFTLDELYRKKERHRADLERSLERMGVGRVIRDYHLRMLKPDAWPPPLLHLTCTTVPWGAALARTGTLWTEDRDMPYKLMIALTEKDHVKDARQLRPSQHGLVLGPEAVGLFSCVVSVARGGVLEASVVWCPREPERPLLEYLLCRVVGPAGAAYWHHQYDGRLLVRARLSDGGLVTEAERLSEMRPAKVCDPWWSAAASPELAKWAAGLAQDIGQELHNGAEMARLLSGRETR